MRAVAHALLHYKTEVLISPVGSPVARSPAVRQEGPFGCDHNIEDSKTDKKCVVCLFECNQYVRIRDKMEKPISPTVKSKVKDAYFGVKRKVSHCSKCDVDAHNFTLSKKRFIHGLFPDKTCMEILHSKTGREIWNMKKTRAAVSTTHPYVKEVRRAIEEELRE